MWPWWSAGVGWSRPPAAASRSAPPASAPATWAPSDPEAADDRRLPRLPRLGPVDGGRTGRRARRRLPRAGRLAAGPCAVRRPEAAMILALWLLALPLRLLAALGLRGSVILACLLVLAVTAYGVAEDLGLVEPPAQAAPAPKPTARQPTPNRAAAADIPAGYLRLHRQAAARYLVDHGARRNLDRALFAYNHSWSYVAKVKAIARRYARGGGRR